MDRFSILWRRSKLPKGVIYHDSRGRDIESDKGDEDYYGIDDLLVALGHCMRRVCPARLRRHCNVTNLRV